MTNYRDGVKRLLGKNLVSNTEVHHIDGDHSNDSVNNLALLSKKDHIKVHQRVKTLNSSQSTLLMVNLQNSVREIISS
jgi:hypothetical protein